MVLFLPSKLEVIFGLVVTVATLRHDLRLGGRGRQHCLASPRDPQNRRSTLLPDFRWRCQTFRWEDRLNDTDDHMVTLSSLDLCVDRIHMHSDLLEPRALYQDLLGLETIDWKAS